MRRQEQNPAYQRYAHLLPKSGRYPVRYVDVFWNLDHRKVHDVEVVFIPRRAAEGPNNDAEFWTAYRAYIQRWDFDLGNSCGRWLRPNGLFPEGIFGHLLQYGFYDQTELGRALEEFAHIEECRWARRMLREFNGDA